MTRRRNTHTGTTRVIAYTRVSTEDQADSHAGLDVQQEALERECAAREWSEVRYLSDPGYSAKSLDRPAITEALALLAGGEADVLLVSKVDRLSRSVADYANLNALAMKQGWTIRALRAWYLAGHVCCQTRSARASLVCVLRRSRMPGSLIG